MNSKAELKGEPIKVETTVGGIRKTITLYLSPADVARYTYAATDRQKRVLLSRLLNKALAQELLNPEGE
jgi:hypothetical protein